MAHVCLQSSVQWRAKSLQQRLKAECEDLAAGAPAEQGPAPGDEMLSQEAQATSGAQCEGNVNQHGSASPLGIVDAAAEMASCNQRCIVVKAHLEPVMHTKY